MTSIRDVNIRTLQEGGMTMRSTWICMTKDLGVHDNAFGGLLLSHVDEVAAVFASEICDSPRMVTKSLSADFRMPIKVKNIIKTYCGIVNLGNTSITISVEMRKYNVRLDTEEVCLRVETTFVKIDEEGKAIPIGEHVKRLYSKRLKEPLRN